MRARLGISLAALALVAASPAGASLGSAGDKPSSLAGATYRFSAAAATGPAVSGKGQLDLDGKFEASMRASRRSGGEAVTVVARVAKFWLGYLPPRKRLTLSVEVTQGLPECPKGSRGTVVLVDDEPGDSVRVRFARDGCSRFEGSWASGALGQRVAVKVTVVEGPSEPSSNLSRVAPAGGGEPGFRGLMLAMLAPTGSR